MKAEVKHYRGVDATDSSTDCRDMCGKLVLSAQSKDDAVFLGKLASMLFYDGPAERIKLLQCINALPSKSARSVGGTGNV
jgi:hypothetical protein